MFSEQIFIEDCNAFLRANTYVDYEDVKVGIEFYININLDADIIDQVPDLAGNILAVYIKYDFDNAFIVEDESDDDDFMFEEVENWLDDVV